MFINYILFRLDSPQCISGFISLNEIKIQAREITEVEGYSFDLLKFLILIY